MLAVGRDRPGGPPGFILGGGTYGIGVALVAPTLSAMTIDRAPAHRLGSAMATYSIGFQLATGASSVACGPLIAAVGFSSAFLLAIGLQVMTLLVSWRLAKS